MKIYSAASVHERASRDAARQQNAGEQPPQRRAHHQHQHQVGPGLEEVRLLARRKKVCLQSMQSEIVVFTFFMLKQVAVL